VTAGIALAAVALTAAFSVSRASAGIGRRRLRAMAGRAATTGTKARRTTSTRRIDSARWASVLAGIALGVVVHPPIGVLVGVVTGVLLDRWLHRLPRRGQAERAERRAADLPLVADLLAAALLSGATPEAALLAVGEAVRPSIGSELVTAAHALGSGASAEEAWAFASPDLSGLADVFLRSAASGTPVAPALATFADQCRAVRRARLRERAGRVGVRSALPLSVCFLPAFLLLGVVPIVAGLVRTLLQ
jgi:Flp pilus assembly protein TadB